MFTAATWFHRFFMRYSLEDYHRQVRCAAQPPCHSALIQPQDVAASCIFLATKTEECGRKLRDVARVCEAKIANTEVPNIAADGKVREILYLISSNVQDFYFNRKLSYAKPLSFSLRRFCLKRYALILLLIVHMPILWISSLLVRTTKMFRSMLGVLPTTRRSFTLSALLPR